MNTSTGPPRQSNDHVPTFVSPLLAHSFWQAFQSISVIPMSALEGIKSDPDMNGNGECVALCQIPIFPMSVHAQ